MADAAATSTPRNRPKNISGRDTPEPSKEIFSRVDISIVKYLSTKY